AIATTNLLSHRRVACVWQESRALPLYRRQHHAVRRTRRTISVAWICAARRSARTFAVRRATFVGERKRFARQDSSNSHRNERNVHDSRRKLVWGRYGGSATRDLCHGQPQSISHFRRRKEWLPVLGRSWSGRCRRQSRDTWSSRL